MDDRLSEKSNFPNGFICQSAGTTGNSSTITAKSFSTGASSHYSRATLLKFRPERLFQNPS